MLSGEDGHDLLDGDGGKDTLDSGKGNDWLRGSEDADTCIFRRGDGQDYISGLEMHDTIEFIWGDEDVGRFRFIKRDDYGVIIYGDGGTDDDTVHAISIPGGGRLPYHGRPRQRPRRPVPTEE